MTGSIDEFYTGQDIGNDRNVAGRIFLTDFVDGRIVVAGDADMYVLRTEIGATYTIEPNTMDGIDITFIDETGTETPGRKSFTAEGTSQFFRVTAEKGTADYSFVVVKDVMPETSGAGETFTPGELINDVLNAVGDGDSYTMATVAGRRYGAIVGAETGGVRLAISDATNGRGITETERTDERTSRIAFTATSESTSFAMTAPLARPESTGVYVLLSYAIDVLSNAANNLTADRNAWVEAGGGNDTVRVDDGLTILDGQAGNDVLDGSRGQGVLIGGAGNDVFIIAGVDEGRDSITELAGQGRDEVRSVESIILTNHANVEIARLTGSAAVNVDGTTRADTIFGNTAKNALSGAQGADTIDGGRGADTITGELGKDLLIGGKDTSRDVFVFASTAESGKGGKADMLRQFSGTDVIDLRLIDARPAEGDQAFTFNGTKAKAFSVWYSVSKGDAIVSLDVTGDRVADMNIVIDNVTRLNAGDFLL